MAIINVDITTDENDGIGVGAGTSLREAIIEANTNVDAIDTINLVGGLTYNLTLSGANEEAAAFGDLDILNNNNITIQALGGGNATIDASTLAAGDRIFDIVSSGVTLNLLNLDLTGGDVSGDGGAIRISFSADATLNITDSNITGNTASSDGGGIQTYNNDFINISGTTISGNSAGTSGGGLQAQDNNSVTIDDSVISNNNVGFSSGGGLFFDDNNTVTITDTTVSGNSAVEDGGGILFDQNNIVSITSTTVSNNTISGGSIGSNGGGIFVGGGINSDIEISNSTISSNTADEDGGGIFFAANASEGSPPINISNSTIALNLALAGGGVFIGAGDTNVQFDNTIVATNNAAEGSDIFDSGATVTSNGFNLIGDNTSVGATFPAGNPNGNNDIVGTNAVPIDPLLGPLQNNGGLTETHELLAGSPAIDAGDPGFTAPPDFDQRGAGFDRIVNGIVDIGAFESGNNGGGEIDLSVIKTPAPGADLTPLPGAQITYNIEVANVGDANAENASISDIFPAELSGVEWSFTDSEGTPFEGNGDLNVDGVVINGGDTVTITATGHVDCDLTDGTITNTANVSVVGDVEEANLANNTDTDSSFSLAANSPGVVNFGNSFFGTPNSDVIIGNANNNNINGNAGDDRLFGSAGIDRINGQAGNDLVVGGSGNDFLNGGTGDDTLDGACTTLGVGQIDRLTGGGGDGMDTFILGNELGAFYVGNGNADFAYLTDFATGMDTIQLAGALEDYTFMQTTVNNISGQGIFQGGDLVAILQQSSAAPGDFVFV
ncbi:conserved repeat domain protein [Thalassoporum mexicanum PCC 7367]|uniref:choice-of-anchor Q domain-containing protein n=1 Tax=Thalassoporum mexicanum TaxID=3457544 RepID=UPI00029FF8DD|nr:choice-of-anchor Q domain-containing protein [Pseudanabaena sp. PCC 7367]AFY68478.1 conserved repeat domain protein [Pseudanabaena sp. PCC 7367]